MKDQDKTKEELITELEESRLQVSQLRSARHRRHEGVDEIRQDEQWYRAVFDNLGIGVAIVDPTGKWIATNSVGAHMLGYSPEEMSELSFTELTHPDDLEASRKSFQALADGITERYRLVKRYIRKDGTIVWGDLSVSAIRDADGKLVAAAGVIADITDRKRAEKALQEARADLEGLVEKRTTQLRQSQEQLAAQYKAIPVPTYTWQRAGEDIVLVSHNDAAEKITQGRIADLLGMKATEMFGDEPEILEEFDRCFAQRTTIEREMAYRLKSTGEDKYLSVKYAFVPPDLVLVHTEDITERKRAEEGLQQAHDELEQRVDERTVELRETNEQLTKEIIDRKKAQEALKESERKFRDLAELAPQFVYEIDRTGKFIFINQVGFDVSGYSPQDLANGLNVFQLIVPEDRTRAEENIARILRGERLATNEYTLLRKDGSTFPVIVHSSPIVVDNDVVGFRGVAVDITERKHLEDHIRASLKEKEVLLGEIHHRVKNNLAVVSSLLRLQSNDARDEFHKQMFVDAQDRIRSMALAHERLCQTENLSHVNMSEYVANLVDHLLLTSKGIGSMVRINRDVEDVPLGLDRAVPLGFLINELVSNSLRHAYPNQEPGSISISLGLVGENEFELVVRDDGVGMPESVDFEKPLSFGLNLVKLFTQQLRGDIELIRDCGTEFRIRFRDTSYSGKE